MGKHRARLAGGIRHGALLGLGLGLLAMPAAAQQSSLSDPGNVQLQRQLRSLNNRMTGGPSADIQLRAAQQAYLAQTSGTMLTPQQLQAQRDLARVGRDLRQRPTGAPVGQQSAVLSAAPLPRSYGDDELADSRPQDSATTVDRLLDRAEVALKEKRPVQARSDLSAARGLLDDVDPNATGSKATYQKLRTRFDSLAQRVAASGNG